MAMSVKDSFNTAKSEVRSGWTGLDAAISLRDSSGEVSLERLWLQGQYWANPLLFLFFICIYIYIDFITHLTMSFIM